MATKIFDGFDHYNASTDLYARSGFLQWQMIQLVPGGANNHQGVNFVTGRNGIGKAVQLNSVTGGGSGTNWTVGGIFADRNAEGYFGFAVKNVNPYGMYVFIMDTVASGAQLTLRFNENNYSIECYRGNPLIGGATLLGISANNVWTNDVWQFWEFHPVIANSGGSIEVRVNNVVKLTLTGLDTQASGNAWFDAVSFIDSPWDHSFITVVNTIDDFYYNDTTSGPGLTPMNSYAGDSAVRTLFPIGNDAVQFTPFAGSNWSEVSEVAMDSDVSYNFSSTVGNEDRFNFQTIASALDTVYAVQVTGAYRKDDGGTRTIVQSVKSGSTEDYSSGHNVPDTTYAYFTDLWVLNPATSLNWTKADVNGMKAAYKLTA